MNYHILTSLSKKYNFKRKTLEKWKVQTDWKPYDTTVHGSFNRIFTNEQEKTMSEYIQFNYINEDLYFSDKYFLMLAFERLENIYTNQDMPKFICSPHFISNFKERNRFSSRRAHFKRRPEIADDDPKIEELKSQVTALIENGRRKGEPFLNTNETQWQILLTNIQTWAKKNPKNFCIKTIEDQKFHITSMATIFTDSENSKLHCFLIAHGIYEDDEETQFGEDYDPSACSHSAKFYMTKKIFVKYL
ncbi:hypothetical protein M9Y10_005330 [Tritrichomonas musculus]|uniref:Uncharacterized protein n=1 Tax=Tritrichomonas musculus TaxID=1915356 RepID=A0ABR2JLA5_9EUKA